MRAVERALCRPSARMGWWSAPAMAATSTRCGALWGAGCTSSASRAQSTRPTATFQALGQGNAHLWQRVAVAAAHRLGFVAQRAAGRCCQSADGDRGRHRRHSGLSFSAGRLDPFGRQGYPPRRFQQPVPGWRNWQTRQVQVLVLLNGIAGSTPAPGTTQPGHHSTRKPPHG